MASVPIKDVATGTLPKKTPAIDAVVIEFVERPDFLPAIPGAGDDDDDLSSTEDAATASRTLTMRNGAVFTVHFNVFALFGGLERQVTGPSWSVDDMRALMNLLRGEILKGAPPSPWRHTLDPTSTLFFGALLAVFDRLGRGTEFATHEILRAVSKRYSITVDGVVRGVDDIDRSYARATWPPALCDLVDVLAYQLKPRIVAAPPPPPPPPSAPTLSQPKPPVVDPAHPRPPTVQMESLLASMAKPPQPQLVQAPPSMFICRVCKRICSTHDALVEHERVHHSRTSTPSRLTAVPALPAKEPATLFECSVCKTVHPTLGTLALHELVHQSRTRAPAQPAQPAQPAFTPGPFLCAQCPVHFLSRDAFLRHYQLQHAHTTPTTVLHTCPGTNGQACSRRFKSRRGLTQHLTTAPHNLSLLRAQALSHQVFQKAGAAEAE